MVESVEGIEIVERVEGVEMVKSVEGVEMGTSRSKRSTPQASP